MSSSERIILFILSLCLVVGGSTHVIDIVLGGFLPYSGVPIPLNIFWTSLAFFDFAAVFLIWKKRKAGLLLMTAIMLADVIINSYAGYYMKLFQSFAPLQAQSLFLGFVLGSIAFIWPKRS